MRALFLAAFIPCAAVACPAAPPGAAEIVYHRELSGHLAAMAQAEQVASADHVIRYADGANYSTIIIVDRAGCKIVEAMVPLDFWAAAKLAAGLSSERLGDAENAMGF